MTNRIMIAAALATAAFAVTVADARPTSKQNAAERMTTRQLNEKQLASAGAMAAPVSMPASQAGPADPAAAPETATSPMTTETTSPADTTTPNDAAPMPAPPR